MELERERERERVRDGLGCLRECVVCSCAVKEAEEEEIDTLLSDRYRFAVAGSYLGICATQTD